MSNITVLITRQITRVVAHSLKKKAQRIVKKSIVAVNKENMPTWKIPAHKCHSMLV